MAWKQLKEGLSGRKARAAMRGVVAIAKNKAIMGVPSEEAKNVEFSSQQ